MLFTQICTYWRKIDISQQEKGQLSSVISLATIKRLRASPGILTLI